MEKVAMTVEEMAQAMGISRPTAYTLVKSEGFPAIQMGRRIVVPIEPFNEWITKQTQKGCSA